MHDSDAPTETTMVSIETEALACLRGNVTWFTDQKGRFKPGGVDVFHVAARIAAEDLPHMPIWCWWLNSQLALAPNAVIKSGKVSELLDQGRFDPGDINLREVTLIGFLEAVCFHRFSTDSMPEDFPREQLRFYWNGNVLKRTRDYAIMDQILEEFIRFRDTPVIVRTSGHV